VLTNGMGKRANNKLEKSTLEDVYEPYLVFRGFILRTARGRMLSESGKKHLQNISVSL
jgi:Holliday junction DNA helicase RuvB